VTTRLRRLQADVVALQSQLDERDDADDEIGAVRDRVRDLERALSQADQRLADERRESDQLRRAQVRHEQRYDVARSARTGPADRRPVAGCSGWNRCDPIWNRSRRSGFNAGRPSTTSAPISCDNGCSRTRPTCDRRTRSN
jgi:hypothetical protein